MKRTLTLVAAAAMAMSLFATAAAAATTSDYKDLTTIDAALKSKIDTLLAKGIFEGVSNDTFGISDNMTRAQFAKVASLVFGVKVDTAVQTSSFSDVSATDPANGWAIPYIEAAKKAGLLEGMTATTFAPGDKVTIGQLDTVFVRGLGKTVNTTGTPWYDDAVKQATALGIHPADKDGDASAARSDLVIGAYGSVQAVAAANGQGSATQTPGSTTPTTPEPTLPEATTGSSVTMTAGDLSYSLPSSYELSNVIDRGLTAAATGTSGNVSKSEAEDPAVSLLAKEVEFTIRTASGDEVAAPGIIQSIVSNNPSIVKTGISADHKGYILGNKAGAATVGIVFKASNGDIKNVSIPVTVKDSPVNAVSIEARDTSINLPVTVTGSVYAGQFNAYEAMDLKITDNFGNEYEQNEIQNYNFALGTFFFAEDVTGNPAEGAVGTVNIDADGTVHAAGNVASFTVTAIVSEGTRVSSYVTVVKP